MITIVLQLILMMGSNLTVPSIAETGDWHINRFSTSDGLASSDISMLFQDVHHFLWIGHSAGVSRFDGYGFENYLFADNQRIGKVYAIVQDRNETIWVGAEGGLFYFRHHGIHHAVPDGKPFKVYSLAMDQNDQLWGITDQGPARFSGAGLNHSSPTEAYVPNLELLPGWQNSSGTSLASGFISIARDGTVFISNRYELFKYAGHQLTRLYTIPENRDYITGISGLNQDTVYVASQISGLWMMDGPIRQNYSFSDGIGNYLSNDQDRLLYFAYEGIYEITPRTGATRLLIKLSGEYLKWGSCVLRDSENNLWIGTHEELFFARPVLFHAVRQPELEGFDELYSGYENEDGSLLFGGNRGRLFSREKEDPLFTPQGPSVFPLSEVLDIHKSDNGDTWFCSGYQGLSLLRNGRLVRYDKSNGLRSNGHYTFISTPGQRLFVTGENGITEIVTDSTDSVSFHHYTISSEVNTYTIVTDGIAIPGNSLLLASDHGLLELRNDSLYHVPVLNTGRNHPSITGIDRDQFGNIWLSTIGEGILMCRKKGDDYVLVKQFDFGNGLSTPIYLQLLIDDHHVIWAVGYDGIIRIAPASHGEYNVSSYSHNHGFPTGSYHWASMMQENEGRIWVVTTSGLMWFDPGAFEEPSHMPVSSITGLTYSGKPGNTIRPDLFKNSETTQLPYRSGPISFHYTGVHLSNPDAVQYAYRLSGSDTIWNYTGSERSVNFQKLSPGEYAFQVKSSSGNNVWGNIASYSFEVRPPVWHLWWFILLTGLLLIALSAYFITRREKNIQFRTESLRHQLEIEQVINFFATSISDLKSIEAMLWDVTKNCISKLGFEDCVIYLKDEKDRVLVQKAAWGPKSTGYNTILTPIEIGWGQGIVGSVAQTGRPEIIPDTEKDSRYIVDDIRRRSEISVPIFKSNDVIGVIDSEHSQKNFYTERHLQILTTISSLISDKIDKIKAEQKVSQKEIELLKLNQELTNSQLVALRVQMNPHFIFNALNSVQQYILQGEGIEANKYLSKFSRLQREILNHCDHNFIFLEKEMEMLELYLQLEQLRFDGLFSYRIEVDDAIDPDEIQIPPMLIQPFVENAIWHGLMPKPDHPELNISYHLIDEDILQCTVRDNGIGRVAAARMQQVNGNSRVHKSKGISLVHDRMNVLQRQYRQPFEISITDLTDEIGNSRGTQVTVTVFIGHENRER